MHYITTNKAALPGDALPGIFLEIHQILQAKSVTVLLLVRRHLHSRPSRPKILTFASSCDPDRIVWQCEQHKSHGIWTLQFRFASFLDEIVTNKKQALCLKLVPHLSQILKHSVNGQVFSQKKNELGKKKHY